MADHTVRVLSLCSGAGGLDLGLRLALPAARTVCYVERDAAAVRVLDARMRDGWLDPAPLWDDLTTFDAAAWRGAVDLVVAGFPCQPVSVAGKRRAQLDSRWLWGSVLRAYVDSGAEWLFLENVRGIVTKGLPEIIGSLADLGRTAEWTCLRASDVGASHRRERWFCLAHRECERPQGGGEAGTAAPTTRLGGRALADAERGEQAGNVEWPPGPAAIDKWQQIIRARPDLAPAVETEPAVRRVADGLAHRVDVSRAARLRLCGNGAVPLQAAAAFSELLSRMHA